jgi:hypothetical protein
LQDRHARVVRIFSRHNKLQASAPSTKLSA